MTNMTSKTYRLQNALGYQLSAAHRMYRHRLDDLLRKIGLNRLEFRVLTAIGRDGCATPSAISDLLGIEKTGVSRVLRRLETGGLTYWGETAHDRRVRMIALTPTGQQVLTEAVETDVEAHKRMFRVLDAEELDQLEALLRKLNGATRSRDGEA